MRPVFGRAIWSLLRDFQAGYENAPWFYAKGDDMDSKGARLQVRLRSCRFGSRFGRIIASGAAAAAKRARHELTEPQLALLPDMYSPEKDRHRRWL
jgi:hypothetical protein